MRLLLVVALAFFTALTVAGPARAGVPITLYQSFAGNLDFVGTAGSLRVGTCGVAASGSGTLSGIPAGATIEAAYLYWAKSGAAPDTQITLDTPSQSGLSISADRTFDENYTSGSNNFSFFSGFADVTAEVQSGGNGVYTVSNLSFSTGAPYSTVSVCLGGWSLVVVYEAAGEPLRVVNVFDGFQNFRGNAISLTPDNFVVPPSPINGKLGHITWEGDLGNSAPLNGFQEQLRFEGAVLADPPDNPSNNQFNSVSSASTPTSTPEGVDFDIYDLAPPLISAGQTSATTMYSSGGDRVLLTGEVFSITNTPVADLTISKTSAADFGVGEIGRWSIDVANGGPSDEPGPILVSDTLPAGVTFDAAAGTGWSCSFAGGIVDCSHPGPLAAGANLPTIALDVVADASAIPSVDNTATVTGSLFDNVASNNSSTATTNVVPPDLTTSTKSVVDQNGGEAAPGDVLRYTISIIETAGAGSTAVGLTDDLPANIDSFALVTLPSGATDNSTGAPSGANGTGFLDLSGITVPASGTVDVVFDVTVAASAIPGAVLSNTATITVAPGTGATPAAPDVTVLGSQVPGAGSKALYLGNPAAAASRALSRTAPNGLPPSATLGNIAIDRPNSDSWTLGEPLEAPLSLSGADFPVVLFLRKGGTNSNSVNRTVQVDVSSTSLGTIATATLAVSLTGTPQPITFTMSPGASLPDTLPAGDVITLTVTNATTGSGNRRIRVFPAIAGGGGGNSRVELNATTVINVDDVSAYDGAYPGGSIPTNFAPGDPISLRALVSDPFGAFDIASAAIEVRDAVGATVFGPVAMAELAPEETASTKTWESQFTLPTTGFALGNWSAHVTAVEGEEAAITDLGIGFFDVTSDPDVVIFKLVTVLDDPSNGSTNPKAIPGANVVYTIGISNQGPGAADDLVIEDVLPSELELFVDVFGNRGPLQFADGTPASGLDVVFTSLADDFDDLEFDDGSGNWTLDPTADAEGFDASVTAIRVRPTGSLAGSGGTPPSFEVRFRARIK